MIIGANFEYANIAGADMQGALSDKPNGRLVTELDVGLDELLRLHRLFVESCGTSGQALDLGGFDMRSAGALTGAFLTMLKARHTVFFGLDLSHAAMQSACCDEADFRDCTLDAADMRGIVLTGAMLSGASMQGAKLQSLMMDAGQRMQSDLSGAHLRHVNLRGADLRGVLFGGADLSFADLTGADVREVDFKGAKLVGCRMPSEPSASTGAGEGTAS